MHNCNEGGNGLCVRVVLLSNILCGSCDGCVDCDMQKTLGDWRSMGLGPLPQQLLFNYMSRLLDTRYGRWSFGLFRSPKGKSCTAYDLVECTNDIDLSMCASIEKSSQLFGQALSCRSLCIVPAFAITTCPPVSDFESCGTSMCPIFCKVSNEVLSVCGMLLQVGRQGRIVNVRMFIELFFVSGAFAGSSPSVTQ